MGHSQVASALVPLSRAYYTCFLSAICTHLFPLLEREPSLTHLYSLQDPVESLLSLQWNLMDVCAGVQFLFQVCSVALGFIGLICESGIHAFSEREMGSTWLLQSHQKADENSPL